MKTLTLLTGLFAFLAPATAQQLIKTVEISDTIVFATLDRPGDLYLVTQSGHIQKFNEEGKIQILYQHDSIPTWFDPRDGARLFAYYRQRQQYDYLNPSFDVTQSFRIDPSFALKPWLIAPSGDHKLWVLDGADHSLKKINPQESVVEVEVIIDTTLIRQASDYSSLREYQGFVFLLNPEKGIHIFNGLGKHIKNIDARHIKNFHFLGEELYYLTGNTLTFFNLFTAETRSLKTPVKADFILLTDTRMIAVQSHYFHLYKFTP